MNSAKHCWDHQDISIFAPVKALLKTLKKIIMETAYQGVHTQHF